MKLGYWRFSEGPNFRVTKELFNASGPDKNIKANVRTYIVLHPYEMESRVLISRDCNRAQQNLLILIYIEIRLDN